MPQNRLVILCMNLKPAKYVVVAVAAVSLMTRMRGILSQAMVMCAKLDGKIEILTPPEGSQPGDLVEFEGYPRLFTDACCVVMLLQAPQTPK